MTGARWGLGVGVEVNERDIDVLDARGAAELVPEGEIGLGAGRIGHDGNAAIEAIADAQARISRERREGGLGGGIVGERHDQSAD